MAHDTRPRVVVVTGASAGVGRATVRAFASAGASIGALARRSEHLDATRAELETRGVQVVACPTDVSDPDQVERAASVVEANLGPIDVWVNNAMTTVFSPFESITAGEFRRVTDVTYLGTVYGTQSALRRMLARDRGVIIQVGSALSHRAIPLQSGYCGAKHAVRGFTESLRCELRHQRSNVKLTMVQLPALNTPQFGWCRSRMRRRAKPIPPIYQPELAASAIEWASRHPRREHFVAGPTIGTVLVQRVAPGLLDRYLSRTGYESQTTLQDDDPDRPDNLFEPIHADRGAHGSFDDRSHAGSALWWAAKHRTPLLAAAAGTAIAVTVVSSRTGREGTLVTRGAGSDGQFRSV